MISGTYGTTPYPAPLALNNIELITDFGFKKVCLLYHNVRSLRRLFAPLVSQAEKTALGWGIVE